MDTKSSCILPSLTCLLVSVLAAPYVYAAANFNIIPTAGKAFPTSIQSGSTVSAFYTIINNTSTARIDYTIKGLPSAVTLNQTGSTCTYPINLAGRSSCMIQLDISSPVQSNFALCRYSSCTSAAVPLNVVAATAPTAGSPLIAAGAYLNPSSDLLPLLVSSTDGTTWSYKVTGSQPVPFPPTFNLAGPPEVINTTSCSGKTCIAAGLYDSSSIENLFIMASTDSSVTWQYTLDANGNKPNNFSAMQEISSASCSTENNCVVTGRYSTGSNIYALIAYSSNKGQNWSYPIDDLNTPSNYEDFSIFKSISCSGNICAAAGTYSISHINYGLIATSSDYGASWTYTLTSSLTPIDYVDNLQFNAVSCSGSTCMAGGYYNSGGGIQYPLIATSSDGGTHWNYTLDSSNFTPPGFVSGKIDGISCTSTHCVAAGTYFNGTNDVPFAAVTSNGGATWTNTLSPPPDFYNINGGLYVSCSGTTCVLAGNYVTTAPGNPDSAYIATSNNNGTTWAYTLYGTNFTPPGYSGTIDIYSVNCNNQACIVSGDYSTASISLAPLVVQSTDNGQTWTYPVNVASPQLPADLNAGVLTTTSAGIPKLLPDYLKLLF